MTKKILYESKVAIHPGEHLADVLYAQGITQTDIAKRTNLTRKLINEIVNGRAPITPETAYQLEPVLGLPNTFWLRLQSNYDLTLKRITEISLIKENPSYFSEALWLKETNYSELVSFGFVQPTQDKTERIFNLRKLARVANLDFIDGLTLKGSARRANVIGNSKADALWRQIALTRASNVDLMKFSKTKLIDTMKRLRKYSTEDNMSTTVDNISNDLANCGVSLVIMPHLKNSGFNGYTEKIKNGYMVIVTLRNKSLDGFWFSLLHELSHIVLGHIDREKKEEFKKQEDDANTNAKNMLITPDEFLGLKDSGDYSVKAVIDFANSIEVNPCIVRGRLCYEELINYNQLLTLRITLKFV